jgi:ribose transport system ATP-binding protein
MLEVRGLTKRYPGVTALDAVEFSVGAGEVVALIGENGAGKSTLIKILGGIVQPDGGEIKLDGNPARFPSPAASSKKGIALIHQELSNLTNLDIAGNVFLGREPRKLGWLIDQKKLHRKTQAILEPLGLKLSPDTPLASLSIAHQQMVEIAKALSLDARFIVMDEPTSSLTAGETETLLSLIKDLRAKNVGIVYVSHRLDEVKAIADRVVAFRDGKNAGNLAKDEISSDRMVQLMVGRDIEANQAKRSEHDETRLEVRNLRTSRYPAHEVSFSVAKGEIVGMAGLVGSGRTEVVQAICGVTKRVSGAITLDGEPVKASSPKHSIRQGLFLAPEDRRQEGLITEMRIRENITLPALNDYSSAGLISKTKERTVANKMSDQLRIKAPTIESNVRDLSGGNQQKVVLAKWLSLKPKCLVLDEPTRGIDVGARAEIYGLIRQLAEQEVAVLVVSSDMEEVIGISDRVVVMHEGRVSGVLQGDAVSEENIMSLAVANA